MKASRADGTKLLLKEDILPYNGKESSIGTLPSPRRCTHLFEKEEQQEQEKQE
jgi:hypothetical protein